jgi:hypothetical protein
LADYAYASCERDDELAARICAVVYNMHRASDADAKDAEDFMPVVVDE